MNPLLSEVEEGLVSRARGLAETDVGPAAVAIDRGEGDVRDVLSRAHDAGVFDAVDGVDPLVGLVLALEEVGRASAAVALVAAGDAVARSLLVGCGLDDGGQDSLGLVGLTGERPSAAAGDGWTLDGTVGLVAGATSADRLVVVAEDENGSPLVCHVAVAGGVEIADEEPMLGLRGCGAASVRFSAARVETDAGAAGSAAQSAVTAARRAIRVAHAALAVGVAQAALDAALEHVASRRAAGDRIDRRQAVQWMLADIATETEAARLSTWNAAAADDRDAGTTASMSRLLAADAAVAATRRAVQVCGIAGALSGSAVERLYRDAKVLELFGETNEDQLRAVADDLLAGIDEG